MAGNIQEHRPVLIIGAGISGMVLSRLLARYAIPSIVFEATTQDQILNTGMTLKEWAYAPLLAELPEASLEDLKGRVATDRILGGNGFIDGTIRDNRTGETLMAPPPAKAGAEGGNQFRADRDALREWFSEGYVEICFGHKLRDFEGEAGCVLARFENGAEVEGSLIVASDGLHSTGTQSVSSHHHHLISATVRQQLLPHIKPVTLPVVALHGDVRLTHEEFKTTIRPSMGTTNILAGIGDNFNTPLTIARVTPEHVDLDWSYSRPVRPGGDPLFDPRRSLIAAADIPPAFLAELAAAPLAPPFSLALNERTVRQSDVWNLRSRSVFVPRAALDKALARGAVLLGDAAHAMPMFGGEGGNHALLDGVELARALRASGAWRGASWPRAEMEDAVRAFYDGAYARNQDAVRRCRQRFGLLHRPISEWRKLGELQRMRQAE